jgi:hypothetical protein
MTLEGAVAGLSAEELRAAVRAVLREVLPDGLVADSPAAATAQPVTLTSDADLTAFVRRVAALCEDPQRRVEMQEGRHGFRLAEPADAPRPAPRGVSRVERGAVTERAVAKAAAEGSRLLLGRGAVLTPLARDKARTLGVEIERER